MTWKLARNAKLRPQPKSNESELILEFFFFKKKTLEDSWAHKPF